MSEMSVKKRGMITAARLDGKFVFRTANFLGPLCQGLCRPNQIWEMGHFKLERWSKVQAYQSEQWSQT